MKTLLAHEGVAAELADQGVSDLAVPAHRRVPVHVP
jgi:hypothetical protein